MSTAEAGSDSTAAPRLPADADGEGMAARVRAFDWSRTPLGPMDGWPQSLRAAVGICLNSRFPMMIWWGPSLTNIYNDAYAPVLGARHPAALGRSGQDVWAEIWTVVAPQVEAVMRRGESTWNERVHLLMERNGFPEDTWFTWSYSPIPDDHGGIGGLFNTCREETDLVLAERERNQLLAELAAERARLTEVFKRSPSFMAVLRGPRHVFELTNDRYDQHVGHRALIGKPVRDALPELAGQGFFELLDRVYATGEPFGASEVRILLQREPDRPLEERIVEFVYQPMHEADGSVSGVFVHGVDLTDRARAEARLARDATLLANVRDSVIVTDLEGVITFWNAGATRLFGFEASETIGRPYAERLPEPERAEVSGWITRIAAGEAEFDGEWLDHRRDGSRVWIEATTRRIVDAEGKPIGIMGVARDISERKRAEAATRQSEERWWFLSDLGDLTRDLVDPERVMATVARRLGEHLQASRCAYAEVEADGERFTIRHDYTDGRCASTVGEYALSLFGARAAADQRGGRTLLVHDVDAELAPDDGADTFNAIGIKAIVCCPLVKGGRLAAMMAVHQSAPRRWTPEEVGLVEAVAERSWAYVERARVARALRQSEAEFRLLADAMPQIVWAARPDGVLDYYNRRWFDHVGLSEHAAAEATWDRHVHPDDLPGTYDAWRAALHAGHPYTVEFRVRGTDGAYRWFLARALPIRDADGQVVRWFGTCTDIHDQKVLQGQFAELLESERAARAEAERTSRIKDDFLATLSHELRTPLNAILGWSQILRRGGAAADPKELDEGLDTIERNARAQTQIIEDLLDMSRIISGKIRLDVQPVDLAAVVHGAIETQRPAADAKGIRIHGALDPRASGVSGDPNRLQQVFWNLLSNAVKFTPRGGEVRVALGRVGPQVEVSVADTGQGIKPEFLPHVFDRFRQADASTTRQHGGLGLGLSIVRQLVELHGGTVGVHSGGPGLGTTFTVTLPLAVGRDHEHGHAAPTGGHAVPTSGGRNGDAPAGAAGLSRELYADACVRLDGVRVLVVDDEPDARSLVKRLLEDCAATVTTAASAAEAFRLLQAERPHVLVSDIGMPGEDGYTLIRRVRALGPAAGGDLPALALTAYARAEDRVRAVRAGFQTHVVKPVEPAELITMVASLVGRAGE